jgi:hypothetical protein
MQVCATRGDERTASPKVGRRDHRCTAIERQVKQQSIVLEQCLALCVLFICLRSIGTVRFAHARRSGAAAVFGSSRIARPSHCHAKAGTLPQCLLSFSFAPKGIS